MSELVKVEVVDGIQIITINRPQAKNAINLETAQAVAQALDELDSRSDICLGILTGAGGTFSSGMDLKAFAENGQRPLIGARGFTGLNEAPPKKPLIAAMEVILTGDMLSAERAHQYGLVNRLTEPGQALQGARHCR